MDAGANKILRRVRTAFSYWNNVIDMISLVQYSVAVKTFAVLVFQLTQNICARMRSFGSVYKGAPLVVVIPKNFWFRFFLFA